MLQIQRLVPHYQPISLTIGNEQVGRGFAGIRPIATLDSYTQMDLLARASFPKIAQSQERVASATRFAQSRCSRLSPMMRAEAATPISAQISTD